MKRFLFLIYFVFICFLCNSQTIVYHDSLPEYMKDNLEMFEGFYRINSKNCAFLGETYASTYFDEVNNKLILCVGIYSHTWEYITYTYDLKDKEISKSECSLTIKNKMVEYYIHHYEEESCIHVILKCKIAGNRFVYDGEFDIDEMD